MCMCLCLCVFLFSLLDESKDIHTTIRIMKGPEVVNTVPEVQRAKLVHSSGQHIHDVRIPCAPVLLLSHQPLPEKFTIL